MFDPLPPLHEPWSTMLSPLLALLFLSYVNAAHYDVKEKLGSGTYATCYRAVSDTGIVVAVKIFRKTKSFVEDELALDSLANEIAILEFCKTCRSIVGYIGENCDNENIYLIMEYAKFGTLGNIIKSVKSSKTVFSTNVLKRMFFDLASACRFMEEHSIIHMDIHPGNILITEDGTFKLADFGLAEVVSGNSSNTVLECLPPHYPPEVLFDHEPYTAKSDFWSVGHAVISLLAGEQIITANFKKEFLRVCLEHFNHSDFLSFLKIHVLREESGKRNSAAELFLIKSEYMAKCNQSLRDEDLTLFAELASKAHDSMPSNEATEGMADPEASQTFDELLEDRIAQVQKALNESQSESDRDD